MKNGRELNRRGPNQRELLIVGAGGMLGTALTRIAERRGYIPRGLRGEPNSISPTERPCATRSGGSLRRLARDGASGAVVNAAAYTDVEGAEDHPERAYLVNELAAGRLAAAVRGEGLAFVHVSTDFVFDGTKRGAYVETDEPRPLSVYGASKLAGERAVRSGHPEALVVRTAWTYGPGGNNFPEKILRRARALLSGTVATLVGVMPGSDYEAPVLQVVADEVGSPTNSVDLADGLLALLSLGATGVYHLTGDGSCSRYELALETLRVAGFVVPDDLAVEPVASSNFPSKAVRPLNSVLDCAKAADLGVRLPAWQDGLARFVAEL